VQNQQPSLSRRNFLHAGSLLLGSTAFPSHLIAATPAARGKLFTAMGISGSLEQAAALKSYGAEFLTETVGDFLIPDKSDEEFGKNLAKLATSPLPVLACNGFIRPKNLHCTGPEANHHLICQWAETTFRRLQKAGGKFIIFGSGGSRQLPDGWPRKKADEQFVARLKPTTSPSPSSSSAHRSAITSTTSAKPRRSSGPLAIRGFGCLRISITWLSWATLRPISRLLWTS
jgi:hypothetical protein